MEGVEFGEAGYGLVDVEALIIGPRVKVVEQVAILLISAETGDELVAEKHIVYQPYDTSALSAKYGQDIRTVIGSVEAYKRITGDDPVHSDPSIHPSWSAVRNRVRKIFRRRAIRVYAKGAGLERTVFGTSFDIDDLEWYNCPKYPGLIHDPLEECRFFSKYVPEMQRLWQSIPIISPF